MLSEKSLEVHGILRSLPGSETLTFLVNDSSIYFSWMYRRFKYDLPTGFVTERIAGVYVETTTSILINHILSR